MGKYPGYGCYLHDGIEAVWLTAGEYQPQRKYQDRQKECLVNHMSSDPIEPTEENLRQQNRCLKKTTDVIDADLRLSDGETNLPILKDTITEAKYIQELIDAAKQVKQWANQNGIGPNKDGGSTSYSQCRLEDYLMIVEKFVSTNFPALPTNSQPPTEEYLNAAMSSICDKLIGLVSILEDSVLVKYLLDSFNQHLFGMLYFLVDRNSTVKDSFFLLQWVKKTYFRQDHKGCLITQNDVLSVSDPFLLADWLEYSKQKLLTLLQDKISTTLHNILQYEEFTGSCDDRVETFIQVQLDVIQCLNAPIQASEPISHTLKNAVQRLCCDELHCFIKRYVNAQRADETNLLCHFKRLYTCRQLRFYAMDIIDKNNDTDSSTLLMLENMETQSLSSAQQCFGNLAMDNLKKYFNKEDEQLQNLKVTVLKLLANLPQVEQGEKAKQLIVKAAYQSITRAYLQCLMQKKYKKLEKRWTDVGKKIMLDAENLHFSFAKQNGSDDEQKMLLLKMSEILQCRTVDTLKLLCSNLYITYPKESKEYIPSLLHWRGALSRRQIKEVIDVSREAEDDVRFGDHVRSHSHKYCWCC